jgi:hypothetical protein
VLSLQSSHQNLRPSVIAFDLEAIKRVVSSLTPSTDRSVPKKRDVALPFFRRCCKTAGLVSGRTLLAGLPLIQRRESDLFRKCIGRREVAVVVYKQAADDEDRVIRRR